MRHKKLFNSFSSTVLHCINESVRKSQQNTAVKDEPRILNEVDQIGFKVQKHGAVGAILVQGLYDKLFQIRSRGVGVRLKARVPGQCR